MTAIGLVARSEMRARWRWYLLLLLLVVVVTAVVLTAVAGARRTETAYSRLRAATEAADASVEVSAEYFDAVANLSQVEEVAPASFLFVQPVGLELDELLTIAGTDTRFANTFDRPRLTDGRRPSPDRPHEVLVNPGIADRLGLVPGEHLELASLTPEQQEQLVAGSDPGEPAGPDIDVTVVGIGQPAANGIVSDLGLVLLTPAFYDTYRDQIGHFDDILNVKLVDGSRDAAAFEAGVRGVVPGSEEAVIETQSETTSEIEDATRVQAISLMIFAIVAALAGFVAIGQAFAREIGLLSTTQPVLTALGLDRRRRVAALVVPAALVTVAGAAIGVGISWAASPIMPIGFARRVEPDPGFAADWLVLGVGCVAIVLVLVARATLSAWNVARGSRVRGSDPGGAAWTVARMARAGLPTPAIVGVRMAFEPGRAQTAVPVRSALVGAFAGVAGLVAALTFGLGLDRLVTEPAAFGWTWDVSVVTGGDVEQTGPEAVELAKERDISGVADLVVRQVRVDGVALQSYGLTPLEGGEYTTALDGRAPVGADEVLVGTKTLERNGHDVGDTIEIEPLQGGRSRTFTIVGRGVFPEFLHPAVPDSDTGAYNDFALLTATGVRSLGQSREDFHEVLVRWTPGIDEPAAQRALAEAAPGIGEPQLPSNLENLDRVNAFPTVIAAFLVLLAVLGVAHALASAVRRRARDLAVLKTFGFVGAQVRATIAWQATTLAVVGLGLGIPAGLIIGRLVWGLVARNLGVAIETPLPVLAILVAIPATLLLVNALALLPARAAARTSPASVLRSE